MQVKPGIVKRTSEKAIARQQFSGAPISEIFPAGFVVRV
jgi:hypothetical protein